MRQNLNGQSDVERQKLELLLGILEELRKQNVPGEPDATSTERIMQIIARDDALKWMVAASLPSIPATSMEVTVDTNGVLLYENQSEPLLRITVSNDDLAQSIWVGEEGIRINNGARINNVDWRAFVMPSGTSLYAITDVGLVSARVAIGYNIKRRMDDLLRELA